MLDVNRLRLLRELSHRGTLAAVARALSYSPSSVSQQLSVLETEAGVRLLEPVGRGVRLTAQAELLVAHTDELLARLERAEAELAASLEEVTGTVRLAAFQTAAHALVPPALAALAERHPALRVHVTEREPDEAVPALRTREFDLVVAEEYPGRPGARLDGLEYAALQRDPLRLAVPAGATADALADLADAAWVMELPGSPARDWATALCREAGFEPDVRFESTDVLLHARLVATGHAVALLPELAHRPGPDAPALRPLPGDPARRILLVTRRGAGPHPAVTAVAGALAEAAAEREVS